MTIFTDVVCEIEKMYIFAKLMHKNTALFKNGPV